MSRARARMRSTTHSGSSATATAFSSSLDQILTMPRFLPVPSAIQVDAIDLCRTEVANREWLPVLCPAQPSAGAQDPDRREICARNLLEVSSSYFDPDSRYHRNWSSIAVDVFP